MISPPAAILDVNVLLALTWDQHIHHEVAHAIFNDLDSWSTCPSTEAGLVRLLLTEQVVGRKVSGSEALGQLAAIRSVSGWSFVSDCESLVEPHIDTRVLMGRRQVTDLQLVNLAATNGLVLATFDSAICDWLMPEDQRWVNVWSG